MAVIALFHSGPKKLTDIAIQRGTQQAWLKTHPNIIKKGALEIGWQ